MLLIVAILSFVFIWWIFHYSEAQNPGKKLVESFTAKRRILIQLLIGEYAVRVNGPHPSPHESNEFTGIKLIRNANDFQLEISLYEPKIYKSYDKLHVYWKYANTKTGKFATDELTFDKNLNEEVVFDEIKRNISTRIYN